MKTIRLKYDSECHVCGAFLEAGEKAKWYGRGLIIGLTCHSSRIRNEQPETPAGFNLDRADAAARKKFGGGSRFHLTM